VEVLGGNEAFTQRLDSLFTQGRYWHGNEPCHQVPWLFALAGHPEKTRQWVSHILQTEYNDTPGGLSGNDDAGQMSAWLVFASLGFYPVCPGTPDYVLGQPQFRKVTINPPYGQPFTIENTANGPAGGFTLNGKPHPYPTLTHQEIINGGTLVYSNR
jgi:putative alpha-1,2-mannosidase